MPDGDKSIGATPAPSNSSGCLTLAWVAVVAIGAAVALGYAAQRIFGL